MTKHRAPESPPDGKTLFSVKAHRRDFPAGLWLQLQAEAERRGVRWIDALREAVTQYLAGKERHP